MDDLNTLKKILERLRATKYNESVCFTGDQARLLAMYIDHLERGSIHEMPVL